MHQQKMNIKMKAVLLVLLGVGVSCSAVWSSHVAIRSGAMQVVGYADQIGENPPPFVTTTSFSTALPVSPNLYSGVSLSSFSIDVSEEFSFNTTVTALTNTAITISFVIIGNTFVNMARLNFIAGANVFSNFSFYTTIGCFLTSDLWTANIYNQANPRNQTIGPLTLPFNNSLAANGSYLITSMISGMQFKNALGVNNEVQVLTNAPLGGNTVGYWVGVGKNCYLRWICITSVFVNQAVNNLAYNLIVEYKRINLDQNTNLNNISYTTRYDGQDHLFFGFSAFNFLMTGNRYINVENSNIAYVAPYYQTNSMLVSCEYEMLFFAMRQCPGTTLYNPQLYECYTTCIPSSNVNLVSLVCIPCLYSCLTCNASNSVDCNSCDVSRNRNLALVFVGVVGQCTCQLGYLDTGNALCDSCQQYLPGCTDCQNKTVCLGCVVGAYILDTTSNTCGCAVNYFLATGYCLNYPGCLSAFYLSTGTACNSCDGSVNFILTSNYNCVCNMGYSLQPNNTCIHICGNGQTPATAGLCDDANLHNGDGCSSNCTIESNWHCTYDKVNGGISTCVPIIPISITYLYAYRNPTANSAVIYFLITPPLNGSTTNFLTQITSSLPSDTASVFTYDPQTSFLIVNTPYNKAIEQTINYLSFEFQNLSFYSYPMKVTFTSIGLNAKLTLDQYPNASQSLSYISMLAGGIAVLIALFSGVAGLKLVGIQLVLPVQMIYFSLSMIATPHASVSALSGLSYSNGFMRIQPYNYTNNYNVDKHIVNIAYESEFLLSCNVMQVFFFIVLLILLIQFIILRCKETKLATFIDDRRPDEDIEEALNKDEKVEVKKQLLPPDTTEEARLRMSAYQSLKFLAFLIDKCYFTLLIVIVNQVVFSTMLFMSTSNNLTFGFGPNLACNILCLMFVWGNIPFVLHDQQFTKVITFHCLRQSYAFAYLIINCLVISVLSVTYSFSFTPYIMLVLSIGFVLPLLICKPYNDSLRHINNLSSMYFQVMLVISQGLICYLAQDNSGEMASLVVSYMICAMIVVGEVIAVIKLVQGVNFKKAFEDVRNFEEKAEPVENRQVKKVVARKLDILINEEEEEMPNDSVRQGILTSKSKMLDWESNDEERFADKKNQDEPKRLNQDSEINVDQKLNQLQLIKRRLRNNLKVKKELSEKKQKNTSNKQSESKI